MADNKSKELNSKGSFTTTALSVAPAVAGTSVALKKMFGAQNRSRLVPGAPSITSALKVASQFRTDTSNEWERHIRWLRNPNTEYLLRKHWGDPARVAWAQALEFSDSSLSASLAHFSSTIAKGKSENVYDAIHQAVSKNQSDKMLGAFRKFRTNLEAVVGHVHATGSLPNFVNASYKGIQPSMVDQEGLPDFMKHHLSAMKDMQFIQAQKYTRSEFKGYESYMLKLRSNRGHDLNFLLPMTHEGAFLEGTSLRTRYINRDIAIYSEAEKRITKRMSRSEFFLHEFNRSIAPAISSGKLSTQADVNRATRALRSTVFHELETLPNIPDSIKADAIRRYQADRGTSVQVIIEGSMKEHPGEFKYKPTFRPPAEQELGFAMKHGLPGGEKLFAGTSPDNLANGVLSTLDRSQWSLTPPAVSWEARPEQVDRLYNLSDEAMSLAEKRYGKYRILDAPELRKRWGHGKDLPIQAKTLFLDPAKYQQRLEKMGIGKGEAAASSSLKDLYEQVSIKTVHLKNIDMEAMKHIQARKGSKLKVGQVIGLDRDTGRPFTIEDLGEQRVLGMTTHQSQGGGDFFDVVLKTVHPMGEHAKFFGDLKATLHFTNIQEGYDIYASMDDMRKNQALHNKQMLSQLWEEMDSVFQKKGIVGQSVRAREFYSEPANISNILGQLSKPTGKYQHELMVKHIMQLAKEAGIDDTAFGDIFGAVPSVLGAAGTKIAKESGWSDEAIAYMGYGIAKGRSQLFWDNPLTFGVMGSTEPRAFDIFKAGTFGDVGNAFSDDLIQRLKYTNTEAYKVHETLTKSLRSFAGEAFQTSGNKTFNVSGPTGYSQKAFQEWIESGGGRLQIGKGFNDIFVPGADTFKAMGPYEPAGGTAVKGVVSDIYHQIAARGAGMYQDVDQIGPENMRQLLDQSIRDISEHAAPAGKHMGGYLRGQYVGSRFLRAVSQIGDTRITDLSTTGVPIGQLHSMADELERSGLMAPEAIQEMRNKWKTGQATEGWLSRHPLFETFSYQPTMIQPLPGDAASAVVPEMSASLRYKIAGGPEQSEMVQFGQTIGTSMDKDADAAVVTLVNTHGAVERLARSREYQNRYMEHQLRMAFFKIKRAKVGELASVEDSMIEAAQKLGTGQQFVPRLSNELSTARQAVLSHSSGTQQLDAQFLLGFMEQTPISAKKQGPILESLSALSLGLQSKDPDILEANIKNLLRNNEQAKSLIEHDFEITNRREASETIGQDVGSRVRRFNLREAVETITSAQREYDGSEASRLAAQLTGKGGAVTRRELPLYLRNIEKLNIGYKGVSEGLVTISNTMGAIGESMIKNYKPLALGLAGSLAIATVLSTPSQTVGPGAGLPTPQPDFHPSKGANRNENIQPPSPSIGQPTAPSTIYQNRSHLAPEQNEDMNVRIRSESNFNPHQFSRNISQVTGGASSVNLSIRDNRSSQNRHILANKLFR